MSTSKVANPYIGGRGPKPLAVLPRLEARSRQDGECIVWTGPVDKDGYGKVTVNNQSTRAHRAAYEERHGALGLTEFVLHMCDNPPCFADAHLYVGSQQNNMTDRVTRGRWKGGRPTQLACRKGHPYTGRKDSRDHNICVVCLTERTAS